MYAYAMKALGPHLRELRDKQDISLREFAQKLGLSATFVSDIELGKRHPSDDVLKSMSKALGVSLSDLKAHDTRPPVEEMKRRSAKDSRYAYAFRQVIENNISADELLDLVSKKSGDKKKS